METAGDGEHIAGMLRGYFVAQALYIVTQLGIPDLLAEGERTAAALAAETRVNTDALYRTMRALASEGIFVEREGKVFLLTKRGELLRRDVAGSMRAATVMAGEAQYKVWAVFREVVRHGTPGFDRIFRKPLFAFLKEHEELHQLFDEAMTEDARGALEAVLRCCSFAAGEVVVDVGGGMGSLVKGIVERVAGVRGVLLEVPEVAARARGVVGDGVEVVAGDFHAAVPGGDVMILARVLHMFQDGEAAAVLRRCAEGLNVGGRVVIVEQVLRGANVSDAGKWTDLNMMVMTGGRERTFAEYAGLLEAAGFGHAEFLEAGGIYGIVVGKRK